jgi:hypothetical protein
MKQQRAYVLAGLALIAVMLLGAAAQVTREEFDALRKQVEALENKVSEVEQRARQNSGELVLLKGRLERLEKGARAEGGNDQKPQEDREEAAAAPLEGRDLQAWKLAYENLHRHKQTFARKVITGEPTTAYMRRTTTGDYEFLFWTSVNPRGEQQPAHTPPQQAFVTVVDLETELRIRTYELMGSAKDTVLKSSPADPRLWPRRPAVCPRCQGKGQITQGPRVVTGGFHVTTSKPRTVRCPMCEGRGRIWLYGEQ